MKHLIKSIVNQDSRIAFMPIKPVYAERLISGEKHFEFRRRPISFDLTQIVVYASSPVQRILGIVKVNRVCVATPEETWLGTKEFAGIGEEAFTHYFLNSKLAYSIEIKPESTIKLARPIHPKEIDSEFQIPQSFKYVDKNFINQILALGCQQNSKVANR
jgi:predicted transcriptional regulator